MSYRGRHRAPTKTGKRMAALTAAAAIPGLSLATAGTANAGPPGGWGPIIKCESGGNPTAQNPNSTASGVLQFINGTWALYGGLEFAPSAKQATVPEQMIVAERAYAREGTTPWDSSSDCWAGKTGKAVIKAELKTELKIPAKPKVAKPKVAPVEKPVEHKQAPAKVDFPGWFTPNTVGDYEVKPGDTLTFIARDYSTTVDKLVELNPKTVEHTDWIYVGEKLKTK